MNAVTIDQCIIQPLQGHDGDAIAEYRARRLRIEAARMAVDRFLSPQVVLVAEFAWDTDRHAAGQHDVRLAIA